VRTRRYCCDVPRPLNQYVRHAFMTDALLSLSLGSGSALVALVCAGVIWLSVPSLYSGAGFSRALAWALCLLVPLALSSVLYWLPYWMGASSDQASLWAPLVICAWYAAGAVAGLLAAAMQVRRLHRRVRHV
jgi:hypothetical protein